MHISLSVALVVFFYASLGWSFSYPSMGSAIGCNRFLRLGGKSTQISASNDPLGAPDIKPSKQLRKKTLQTFPRYLEIECWKRAELRELEPVLQAIANACKQINRIVQRAQTDDVYGVALGADGKPLEETNVQGEVQQKLDVLCNTIMLRAFCGSSRCIHSVASEEEDVPRCCTDVMVCMNSVSQCF